MQSISKYLEGLRDVNKERWELMSANKEYFIKHPDTDPRTYSQMNPLIAESWVRSQQAGLPMDKKIPERFITPLQLKKLLSREAVLLKIAHEVFSPFRNLINLTGYRLYLFDRQGIMLYTQGQQVNGNSWFSGKIGKICTEETVGTCSHVLSMRYLEPIQLLAVEQYGNVFENMIGTAAPIRDAHGKLHATVVLNQRLASVVLTDNYRETCAHTLGLVASMAEAIELQYKLVETSRQLCKSNVAQKRDSEALSVMLNMLDDGIMSVDGQGMLTHINVMGRQLLGLRKDERAAGLDLRIFTDEPEKLKKLIMANQQDTVELNMGKGGCLSSCQVTVYPAKTQGAILKLNRIKNINASMSRRVGSQSPYNFTDIIGECAIMTRTMELGRKFAAIDEALLICGESGTGKELLAQAIHNYSRRSGPFVALNCAALPRDLIESELFGYERGSFTGADKNGRPGKIELAHEGTLFLDEIGDMPLELQPVFLRVLENKEVIRIGGRQGRKVDFRIIAATNRDLHNMQTDGLFRSDLYFRLSVLTLSLPPLRQRGEDILILARHFLAKYCRKCNIPAKELSQEAAAWLQSYNWPGNVRQLENVIIYAASVATGEMIGMDALPDNIKKQSYAAGNHNVEETNTLVINADDELVTMANWEKAAIYNSLRKNKGNVTHSAAMLGISKATFYKKLRDYHIELRRDFD